MKKKSLFWICLMVSTSNLAQSIESVDTLNDINTIKRDTSFIYAEATRKDAIEAQSDARSILELKLYDWLHSKHPNENVELLVSQSKDGWHDLLTRRGKYNRVFVFVNKQYVLPIVEGSDSVTEVSESVVEEVIPVMDGILIPELTAEEEEMAAIYSFSDIEPYIKRLKADGRLKAYGKYASLPEEDNCYLFIYDRDGSVVAVIHQNEDGLQFNLREKKDDNVRNYKDCGAIWFSFRK